MGDKKLLDLADATGQEAVDVALAEVLPEVVAEYGSVVVPELVASVAGELIGAVFPRLNNIRLSYKQNRLERNVNIMLQGLVERCNVLEARLAELTQTAAGRKFVQQSGELLLDGIVDEFQEQKVRYTVNGYLNLLQVEDANMDLVLMFFKTLFDLSDLDVRMLDAYDSSHPIGGEALDDYQGNLSYSQARMVKEKLARLGLLQSRNETIAEKNLALIIEYLNKINRESRSSRPKPVKVPKFKKPATLDSYSITSLGRTLLQLISEQCDLSDVSVPEEPDEESDDDTISALI